MVGPTAKWRGGHRHLLTAGRKLTDGSDTYVIAETGKRPGSSADWVRIYNEDFPENMQWFNVTIGECDELMVKV